MDNIIWKEIDMDNLRKNCTGMGRVKYYASNTGLIKSVIVSTGKETIRKTHINHFGYESVTLSLYDYKNKKRVSACINVHRIIAKTFIDNPDNKECVNHINEDKTDNRVENLEWCTYSENNSHGTHVERMASTKKLKTELKNNNMVLEQDGQIKFNI